MWLVTWIVISFTCGASGPALDDYGRSSGFSYAVCHWEEFSRTPMSKTFETKAGAVAFIDGAGSGLSGMEQVADFKLYKVEKTEGDE